MKRTDKVIVILHSHVLEDEFSFPFRCPVISHYAVADFFFLKESSQKDEV